MTVIRSKCYSLVGISGIVAMETKNTFKLLGKDNIVRSKKIYNYVPMNF